MAEKIKNHKILFFIILTVVVWFFLSYITPLISPVLIAMLFVTIFGSTMKNMQKKLHIPRQISVVILLFTAGSIIALITWVLFSWIVGNLPNWVSGLDVLEQELSIVVHDICKVVGHTVGVDNIYLENRILSQIQSGIDYFQLKYMPNVLSQSLEYLKMFGVIGGFLMTFVIAAVLLAKDYDDIMNGLLEKEEYHVLLEVICGIIRYIATFVKAQVMIMFLLAGVSAIVLTVGKVQNGILWGILAGILDVLPFIGTGIVFVPLAVGQFLKGFYGKTVLCIVLYIICAFLREFLEPKLIGNKIGISPIAVVLSLYAGIHLFGIWGIVKGPFGFVIIREVYLSMIKKKDYVQTEIKRT